VSTPSPAKTNGQIPAAIPIADATGPDPGTARIDVALVSPAAALETERRRVRIGAIDFDLHNAHKHTPEGISFLASSIAQIGLTTEPLVCLVPETGRFRLIAGEGRVRAMMQLGWEFTYVRCLKGTFTEQQLRDLALIDNLLKEDIDPLAFGLYCLDEKNRTGRSARELAAVLNNKVDASTINRNIAMANKLPGDIHELIRSGKLPPTAARPLTGLKDDEAKRRFARMYVEGEVKTTAELAVAIKSAKNGQATGATAGFTCEERGVKIAVTWTAATSEVGSNQSLAPVENALKIVLKDLREQGHCGLEKFKDFLSKKVRAAKKAEELAAAQSELARHASISGNGGA